MFYQLSTRLKIFNNFATMAQAGHAHIPSHCEEPIEIAQDGNPITSMYWI